MNNLDDAYRAAKEALPTDLRVCKVRRAPVTEERYCIYPDVDRADLAHAAVDAFLAHLADNLPGEMVERLIGAANESEMRHALSAALRSVGRTVAPAVAEEGADYPEPRP